MSVAGFKVELAPSAHWSSAVLVGLGIDDPAMLDVIATLIGYLGPTASADHPSPMRVACVRAVAELGDGHELSPLLAALHSALLCQIPRGLGCPSSC